MENPEYKGDIKKAWSELSTALLDMRDALAELSMALKDWQFDNDLKQRKTTQDMVSELLAQIAGTKNPSS